MHARPTFGRNTNDHENTLQQRDRFPISKRALRTNAGPAQGHQPQRQFIGDVAYFYANDGVHGQELWKTDGTANGTVLVKNIVEGATGSFARGLHGTNGTTYF